MTVEDTYLKSLDLLENSDDNNNSPMCDYFRDKTVFLTGGTGFLGKLMIEKLVRCEVKEIFVLTRSKKGKTASERIEALLEEPIFVLHNDKSKVIKKLRVVEGDLQKPGLGLDEQDHQKLVESVEIVFHVAADVRFDECLKESIQTNVRGTRDIMKLANDLEKLNVFVYMSTAFANCIRPNIEEKFYKNIMDADEMIRVAENVKNNEIDNFQIMANLIIKPYPNTYTYSKALAEEIVRKYGANLPVAVIRPSIVTTTFLDPIPGWTDNLYGLNGVLIGAGVGVLRILHIDNNKFADIIPADIVVNSTLAVAWYTSIQNRYIIRSPFRNPQQKKLSDYYYDYENERIQVYNCTVTTDNPITWGDVNKKAETYGLDYPIKQGIWVIRYNTTKYYYVSQFLKILYHFIPALLVDSGLKINGKQPRLLKVYRKVNKFSAVIAFFTNNEWNFSNNNMRKVYAKMSPYDKKFFPSDIREVHWNDFFVVCVQGLRKYINKESLDNLPEAKKRYRKMAVAHYTMLTVLYTLLSYISYKILNYYGVVDTIYNFANDGIYLIHFLLISIYTVIFKPFKLHSANLRENRSCALIVCWFVSALLLKVCLHMMYLPNECGEDRANDKSTRAIFA